VGAGGSVGVGAPLPPVAIACGLSNSAVVTADGRAWVFGLNISGALGPTGIASASTAGAGSAATALQRGVGTPLGFQVAGGRNGASGGVPQAARVPVPIQLALNPAATAEAFLERAEAEQAARLASVERRVAAMASAKGTSAPEAQGLPADTDARANSRSGSNVGRRGRHPPKRAARATAPGPPPRAQAVSLGARHSLVCAAGQLYALGEAKDGQLGLGGRLGPAGSYHGGQQPDALTSPTRIAEPFAGLGEQVVQACAGRFVSVALTDSGAVYTCGASFAGQLGHGDAASATAPHRVMGLPAPGDDPVVRIGAGTSFCLAATASGALYFWGRLGHGGTEARVGGASEAAPTGAADSTVLQSREAIRLPFASAGGQAMAHLACGAQHAAFSDGVRLWTLGLGRSGALGTGSTTDCLTPVEVDVAAVWAKACSDGGPSVSQGPRPPLVPKPAPATAAQLPAVAAVACGPASTGVVLGGRVFLTGRLESAALLGDDPRAAEAGAGNGPGPATLLSFQPVRHAAVSGGHDAGRVVALALGGAHAGAIVVGGSA
jgi:hypothetical protein